MNVIVFGGAGFIGNEVIKVLIKEKYNVVSVDNFISSKASNLASIAGRNYNFDITDYKNFDQIDFDPDIIIHLAFPTPLCNRKRENQFESIASIGTLNILEYTSKTCRRLIYGSSISVYGMPESPLISENTKIDPILVYGAHKFLGELYVKIYSYNHGLSYNTLRISDTFGPNDNRKNC